MGARDTAWRKGTFVQVSHGNGSAAAYVQCVHRDPSSGSWLPQEPSPRTVLPMPQALLAASLDEEVQLRLQAVVRAGYLRQSLHRQTFTATEINGSKMVKGLLGFSCHEGDTLAVFLHHPAVPVHTQGAHTVLMPRSHPQCSTSCSAAAATAGSCSGAALQGLGLGAPTPGASLETAASSQWLLHPGCAEFWPCLLCEGKATCVWDTPASVCWLVLCLMRKQIPICQHMQLSHCWVILDSVY